MSHTVRSSSDCGNIQAGEIGLEKDLNDRSERIERDRQCHTNAVKHSPIISRREVCGRRLDKERVYNPITCRFNSPNAVRPDINPKPTGRKVSDSHGPTSIAGETPAWFSGERRAYPRVTQTAFEQKTKSQPSQVMVPTCLTQCRIICLGTLPKLKAVLKLKKPF